MGEGAGGVNAKLPFNSKEDRLNMGRMRASRITSDGSTSAQCQRERCFSRHPRCEWRKRNRESVSCC